MSTNEIELTFIRCQNCKSLMPSTSQVCGMCGFQRSTDAQDNKAKNRLRQQSDVHIAESVDSGFRGEPVLTEDIPAVEEEKFVFSKSKHNKAREEVFETPRKTESGTAESTPLSFSQERREDKLVFGKKYSEDQSTEVQKSTTHTPSLHTHESSHSEFEEEFEDEEGDFEDEMNSDPAEFRAVANEPRDMTSGERPHKKRKRRKKKKQNMPLAENEQTQDQHNRFQSSTPTDYRERPVSSGIVDQRSTTQQTQKTLPVERSTVTEKVPHASQAHQEEVSSVRGQERISETKKEFVAQEVPRQPAPSPERYSKPTPEVRQPKRALEEGQLVGWLVNYSTNVMGNSFELRIGRRFVGRQMLRQDDLIIQDSAVSTPHALLHVDGQQVVIQDLMSESGTYVKSQGSLDFIKIEASTRLLHGDILKLGNYELIVCLVPQS